MSAVSQTVRAWFILVAMMILILLINVDYTAVNIAMVSISYEINEDLNTLQWLLSAYILTWAASVIPAGQMADIYGKRRMLLWGVSIFMIASILCGFISTAPLLIGARILQGFGGALFVPPLYALVFENFPQNKQGFAIGMLGVGAGIGLAIGPSFGGIILETLGWRWIFLINGPLCLFVLSIIWFFAHKDKKAHSQATVDVMGSLLLGGALAIGIFALNQTEVWGITDFRLLSLLGVSIGFALLFGLVSRKKVHPLIPKGLFRNIPFVGTMVGFSIYSFGFSVVLVMVGLFLQNVQGYDAYTAGIIFLAMTVATGVLSPFGGKMSDHMDPRIPICGGLGLVVVAFTMASFFSASSSLSYVISVLFLMGLGMGLSFPALNATMMKTVDSSILSTASGTFIMGCCTANTLGVVVSTSMLVGLGRLYLDQLVSQSALLADTKTYQALIELLSSVHRDMTLLNHLSASEVEGAITVLNQAFSGSFAWIMGMTSVFMFIALVAGYKMIIIKKKVVVDSTQEVMPLVI